MFGNIYMNKLPVSTSLVAHFSLNDVQVKLKLFQLFLGSILNCQNKQTLKTLFNNCQYTLNLDIEYRKIKKFFRLKANYSNTPKSERSDCGVFGNGSVPKQFRFQTMT